MISGLTDVLFDTDVVVDQLRGARVLEKPDGVAYYSVVTRAELFAGRHVTPAQIYEVLSPMVEIAIGRAIAERAGRTRRTSPGLHLPDALIAATALQHGLLLVTRNRRHFEQVDGLRLDSSV